MADTCIICLNELGGDSSDALPRADDLPNGSLEAASAKTINPDTKPHNHNIQGTSYPPDDEDLIARIIPCGHNLHNKCLEPWVERANSCPICRASFNMVELSASVGGPIQSSYPVQDKQQVADLDPSIIIDDDYIELSEEVCSVCDEYDDRELLACANCNTLSHIFCAGLDEAPEGPWFCSDCMANPRISVDPNRSARIHRYIPSPRARTGGSRSSSAWARVWQSVWNNLHLDLDFPFDEDDSPQRRSEVQRREYQGWQRRLQIAERMGGANRFRDTAPVLLEVHDQRKEQSRPSPESQEELRAWNAFEKAREVQEGSPSPNRRKRRRLSLSPEESDREPERKLKRPRTRNVREMAEQHSDGVAESSRGRAVERPSLSAPRPTRNLLDPNGAGPSFLQSLLKEVENYTSAPAGSQVQQLPIHNGFDRSSPPHISSPGASPRGSNQPTPRALTPPPLSLTRPARPASPPLSSVVTPIFPPAPEFPPFSPVDDGSGDERRQSRRNKQLKNSSASNPPRSKDSSPTRPSMSLSTKSEIQRMVAIVLKPMYHKQEVTKEQYTDINRDVSRLLYDRIGGASALVDQVDRDRWQKVAVDEVENAVRVLKTRTDSASDS